jgi:hypothetical protein
MTEARAVAYVDWLNSTGLAKATKQANLSGLSSVWRFLERKRQVPLGASPWRNHEVTTPKKAPGKAAAGEKRGWQEAEMLTLFRAPDDARAKHYTRSLYRDLRRKLTASQPWQQRRVALAHAAGRPVDLACLDELVAWADGVSDVAGLVLPGVGAPA